MRKAVKRSAKLAREIEAWQGRLAPKMRPVAPQDLQLVLWSILRQRQGYQLFYDEKRSRARVLRAASRAGLKIRPCENPRPTAELIFSTLNKRVTQAKLSDFAERLGAVVVPLRSRGMTFLLSPDLFAYLSLSHGARATR